MDFSEAMRKLETAEGVTPGILALAGVRVPPPAEVNEEAAALARETVWCSYADWREALRLIDRVTRPERDAIIKAVRDMTVVSGCTAARAAFALVGDESTTGMLDAYADHEGGQ